MLKPIISGVDVKRYNHPLTRQYILFPYQIVNGKAELIKESDVKQLAPKTYEHLKNNEKVLRRREGGKFDDAEWYRFGSLVSKEGTRENYLYILALLNSRFTHILSHKDKHTIQRRFLFTQQTD